jgi:hypothetical protein
MFATPALARNAAALMAARVSTLCAASSGMTGSSKWVHPTDKQITMNDSRK